MNRLRRSETGKAAAAIISPSTRMTLRQNRRLLASSGFPSSLELRIRLKCANAKPAVGTMKLATVAANKFRIELGSGKPKLRTYPKPNSQPIPGGFDIEE